MERRLSAILAADMVGYSRLMEADEVETLARQKAHRTELIDPAFREFNGRIVKEMGDGILAEFPSVTDAVQCAVRIQTAMPEREQNQPEDRRITYRFGINSGDVFVEADDIFGDGVNVAARLEQIAEPGGICISGTAFDHLRSGVDVRFEPLGEIKVKNIQRPIRAYKMVPGSRQATAGRMQPAKRGPGLRLQWIGAAVLAAVIASGALWWRLNQPEFRPADPARFEYGIPEKPSIAVLPLENLSGDAELDLFARGLTEDLKTALAKLPQLFVSASSAPQGQPAASSSHGATAEALGVRYLLQGSIQEEGGQLRISARLVDALNGIYLWSERYQRPKSQLFSIQDDIVLRILSQLRVELDEGERTRAVQDTENLQSWLSSTAALQEFLKFTAATNSKARDLWQKALDLDPERASVHGGLAFTHYYDAYRGWSGDKQNSIRLGIENAEKAISLNPELPIGYQALGSIYILQGEFERGIELRRKAVELGPNDFAAIGGLAALLSGTGATDEAVQLFRRAMKLNPKPPLWLAIWFGHALHLDNQPEEAVRMLERAIAGNPKAAYVHARLAGVLADLGRMNNARLEIEKALELDPGLSLQGMLKIFPFRDAELKGRFTSALVRAGLPE